MQREIKSTEKVINDKPDPIKDKKPVEKKGKSLIKIVDTITNLRKQSKISIKELNDITSTICKGKALTIAHVEEVVKE